MKPALVAACFAAILTLVGGCGAFPVRRPAAQLDPKPYLLHLPGVTGGLWIHDDYLAALGAGGFDAETAIYDWTGGRFPVAALQGRERNRAEAQKVARILIRQHRTAPHRPLYLSCESAGAGVALWALEALPDDVHVDAALLISPAVSSDYDLTEALRHVRHRMYVFSSKRDAIVLGLGTSLFGTTDRRQARSAGLVGFQQPADADAAQYAKVRQFPYQGKWFFAYGNGGGHASALNPRFASAWLAPRLIELARQSRDCSPAPRAAAAPRATAAAAYASEK